MQNMQSVMAMSLNNIIAVQSVNNTKSGSGSGNFQSYMDSTGEKAPASNAPAAATDTKVAGDAQAVQNNVASDANGQAVVSDGKVDEGAALTDADTAVVEQVIRDTVKSVLHIDDEVLEAVMAEMGISLIQLVEPAVLQDFMVYVNPGSDVTDFLTDETMLSDWTEISQALEDIDWEGLTGMSREQFQQVLDNLSQEFTSGQPMTEVFAGQSVMPEAAAAISDGQDGSMQQALQPGAEPQKDAIAGQNVLQEGKNVQQQVSSDQPQEVAATDTTVAGTTAQADGEAQGDAPQPQLSQQDSREPLRDVRHTDGQPVTVMNFVENMMQASDKVQAADVAKMQQMIDIVNQVVEKIHTTIREDTTTMEMQLNPESLGKVLLSVSNRNGVMTASFTVQTAEAKEALESQMFNLRETLEQKNLKVESVEVSVSDFTFSQSGQADTGAQKDFNQGNGKRMRFQYDEEQDDISAEEEAEQVRRSVMRDSGSSVDFTA